MDDELASDPATDLTAAVRAVQGGVELAVFCQPKAARSALVGMHGGALKAKVMAPALEGRANEALLAMLAAALGVTPRAVSIVAGGQSRNKRVRVEGVDGPAAIQRLLAALAPHSGRNGTISA